MGVAIVPYLKIDMKGLKDHANSQFIFLMIPMILISSSLTISIQNALAKDATFYIERGIKKANKGEIRRALEDYNKAIEIDPNSSNAYYNRGYDKAKIGDLKGAIKDFTKVIQITPDDADAYYHRANAKNKLKRYKDSFNAIDATSAEETVSMWIHEEGLDGPADSSMEYKTSESYKDYVPVKDSDKISSYHKK